MGSTQSRTPTSGTSSSDNNSSTTTRERSSRPRVGSRISSFGRPTLRKRRTSSNHGWRDRAEDRLTPNGSGGGLNATGDASGSGKGKAKHNEDTMELDGRSLSARDTARSISTSASDYTMATARSSWVTPGLPTSPGPPVLAPAPISAIPTTAESSYFPPIASQTESASPHQSSTSDTTTRPSVPFPIQTVQAQPGSTSSTPPPRTASRTPPRPPHTRGLSLPGLSSTGDRSMTGRLTALLGFSAPGATSPGHDTNTNTPSLSSPATTAHLPTPSTTTFGSPPNTALTTDSSTTASNRTLDHDQDDDGSYNIAALQEEIARARAELEQSRRELDELNATRGGGTAGALGNAAESGASQANRQAAGMPRVPLGATLVIQGLAQTQSGPTEDVPPSPSVNATGLSASESPSATSTTNVLGGGRPPTPIVGPGVGAGPAPRRPGHLRRMSDGSMFRRRREQERERGASLDQQARMIGGLLTVAAAATANSLLQPPTPAPAAPRSGMGGAIDALLERLRPNRSPRHGIEQALGSYLRNAVRDNRRTSAHGRVNAPPISPGAGAGAANSSEFAPDFQAFLDTLQGDLVGAVRAFAGSDDDDSIGTRTQSSDQTSLRGTFDSGPSISRTPLAASAPLEPINSEGSERQSAELAETTSQQGAPARPHNPAIPTFHRQLGQNLPNSGPDRFGVSGGDGQPRSLNFFRAHLFPPVDNGSGVDPEDPSAIVPCIFVGVRSIRHDPAMTTEELVHHPGFPFADGNVPDPEPSVPSTPVAETPRSPWSPMSRMSRNSERNSYFDNDPPTPLGEPPSLSIPSSGPGTGTSPSSPGPQTPPADSRPGLPRVASGPARSFRDRVLARLSRRTPAERPMNTYLVFVIGGNYPRNHPVLRIPNLLTGAPLTDEELQLVSELLGPAKPPTASKDEIENSGLRLVDGAQMKELGEKGEVLSNCVERCLICLGDFEQGEECRVLACKHGYHKDCVDQWLEKGANSCPACRTAAVEKSRPTAAPPSGATEQSLNSNSDPSSISGGVNLGVTPSPLVAPVGALSLVPETDSNLHSGQEPLSPLPSLEVPIPVDSIPVGERGAEGTPRIVHREDDVD